ncbi:hypothetical protein COCOBI_03-7020 [Coccomyxa sp. Obi]|nr:hypothetical protein COCOBI_03-7020 [Coccomyxa sp. Obi]
MPGKRLMVGISSFGRLEFDGVRDHQLRPGDLRGALLQQKAFCAAQLWPGDYQGGVVACKAFTVAPNIQQTKTRGQFE